MQLVLQDDSLGPFLTKVLVYGQVEKIIGETELAQFKSKAVLMSLKFADKFYNKYKMYLLEQASYDVIGLVSLGLIEMSGYDLNKSARILATPDGVVKSFQKAWQMLSEIKHDFDGAVSLYGDVKEDLLKRISSPPDAKEWDGWNAYVSELQQHKQKKVCQILLSQFCNFNSKADLEFYEFIDITHLFSEIVFYRALFDRRKVVHDIKRKIQSIELDEKFYTAAYFQVQTEQTLKECHADNAEFIRKELGKDFTKNLSKTLKFAIKYRDMAAKEPSLDKRNKFETKQLEKSPLLGWPQYVEF